jgi:hypothetical protein|tara:strand:+ start:138 stop:296 length:159 start_codon:yes stop_codon:yes gene_type:complete
MNDTHDYEMFDDREPDDTIYFAFEDASGTEVIVGMNDVTLNVSDEILASCFA